MLPHSPRQQVSARQLQLAAQTRVSLHRERQLSGPVVLVVAGHSGAGASTLALALADAADSDLTEPNGSRIVRLLDAAAPPWSGLAGASDHDLTVVDGWCRGRRGLGTIVDRLEAAPCGARGVGSPPPAPAHQPVELTVVDAGWHVRELSTAGDGWLSALAPDVTLVVTRTGPSELAQTEWALRHLDLGPTVVVLLGAQRRVRHQLRGAGVRVRQLDEAGLVLIAPLLPARAMPPVAEATPTPLLLAARPLLGCIRSMASQASSHGPSDARPDQAAPGPVRPCQELELS